MGESKNILMGARRTTCAKAGSGQLEKADFQLRDTTNLKKGTRKAGGRNQASGILTGGLLYSKRGAKSGGKKKGG